MVSNLYNNLIVPLSLIKIFGTTGACYCMLLTKLWEFKDPSVAGFPLDLKYFAETLSTTQMEIKLLNEKLADCKVISIKQNELILNQDILTSYIIEDNKETLKTIRKRLDIQKERKLQKEQAVNESLKKIIIENEQSPLVINKYVDWITSCRDKGQLSKEIILIFMNKLNSFTKDDNTKVAIIEEAIVHNYRDCDWAISSFNKKKFSTLSTTRNVSAARTTEIKKSDNSLSNVIF